MTSLSASVAGSSTLKASTQSSSPIAGHVVGIEGDQPLVNHAKENALLNNLSNVEFFAADLSKDVSDQAWTRQKYNKVAVFNKAQRLLCNTHVDVSIG
jgi:23S rRNA (uracil1939-C5)-methyltransferase